MAEIDTAERRRQKISDFARFYREGMVHQWSDEKRYPAYTKIQLPKPGKWPGVERTLWSVNRHPRGHELSPTVVRRGSIGGPSDLKASAINATKDTTPKLESYGLKFKKILGWGGLGVASLFELQDMNGNARRKVVVKSDLHVDQPHVQEEKEFFEYLSRAAHIVQAVRLKLKASTKAGSKRKIGQEGYINHDDQAPTKRWRLDLGWRARTPRRVSLPATPEEIRPSPPHRKILQPIARIKKRGSLAPAAAAGNSPSGESSVPSHSADTSPMRGLTFKSPSRSQDTSPEPDREPPKVFRAPSGSGDTSHSQSQAGFRPSKGRADTRGDISEVANVLVIELLSRGDLLKWMNKMGSSRKSFSNKVLWLFLECLLKGVIAMACPPLNYDDFESTGAKDGPMEDEKIPKYLHELGPNMVHFDLDPSNILVGDFNIGNGHHLTPVLKITDFGVSEMIRNVENDADMMWRLRKIGKYNNGYLLPEQFTDEWDWVAGAPATASPKPRVAGNFSWRSNLYHVGMIMWSLVTLNHPPTGPHAYWVRTTGLDKRGLSAYKWSYGGYVNAPRFNHVDEDLRLVIVHLMMNDPADRPTLAELNRIVREKIEGPWPHESDNDTRKWARKFFETPGVMGPTHPGGADAEKFEDLAQLFQQVL